MVRKLMLRENMLWPHELNYQECRERGYCFSSEDGWQIEPGTVVVTVSSGAIDDKLHYLYRFPLDSIAWIYDVNTT